ncbi:aldo/keto reductase [Streptomyces sp. NPDC093595]|uniref:aldo/keto reductase n=1 Tax=Streptomyces sp. NPDC093595 TaxID=3366045 RepID=UPI00381C8029
MERRTIGATALEVGAIGLGCMPMSWAYSASQQRGDRSVRTVHAALDAGVTLLDTADMYGPFTNELLLGRVLKERRADAFVSTKCGLLVGDQHIVANGRPGYVRRACDASLRRLQTDVIDLYQLHRADPEVPVEETWGAMAELVTAGKVRALGLCAMAVRPARRAGGDGAADLYDGTIRQLERVQQVFPVSAVQAELSVWSPEALRRLLPWCESRGVGFLAAMPLGNGFLTGTLTPGGGFEPEDCRARHPRFTAEMMAANQPVVAGLRRIAERHGGRGAGVTTAQVALAWALTRGRHVVPVPGTKHERWAVENAGAAALRLTGEDLAEIAALPPAQGSWD